MTAGRRPSAGRRGAGAGDRPGAGSRPGVRPAGASSGRPSAPAGSTPIQLGRLLVFAGVLVVLAVLLVPAMRSYLAQRQQISALEQHVVQQKKQVADLEQQRAAWNDPTYVRSQARERLKFVMPGDRAYNVIAPPATTPAKVTPLQASARKVADDRPWFGSLWDSVQLAGGTGQPGQSAR